MPIRKLDKNDLEFAAALTAAEGWFYTPRELEVMLRLDPEGSFVYEDGERMGFATSVAYGRTGVLGHLIVGKKGRGRKIGQSLLQAALEHMESRGAESILLYATHEGVRLYEKHGFTVRDEIFCAHLNLEKTPARNPSRCEPLTRRDLPEVVEIDQELFGDRREKLLNALYDEGVQHGFKIERDGRLAGYIMGRHDHVGYDLGPWACLTEDPEDAEDLFRSALSTMDPGTIYMGSFLKNPKAIEISSKMPIVRSWRIPLMIRGKGRYESNLSKLFGIAAFELG